jgi:hypothetical protein
VLSTAAVTVALALAAFAVLRLAFPDPAIEGSHCPASLGEPAHGECIRSWHRSHAARDLHHLTMGLGVILVVGTALLALQRMGRLLSVRLPLALAGGAGFALLPVFFAAVEGQRAGFTYLAAAGLFVLARSRSGSRGDCRR